MQKHLSQWVDFNQIILGVAFDLVCSLGSTLERELFKASIEAGISGPLYVLRGQIIENKNRILMVES